MPWWDTRSKTSEEPEEVVFDDGGSGLLEACRGRFTGFGWTVECDSHHAVWVRGANGSYAIGLAPWTLDRRPLDETLDEVELKMKVAEARLID